MDEFGMGSFGLQGYNRVPTRNPIDTDHCAGGSSAGSASATKAYTALAALGTDTGGSVNYPAHCCGLVSLKPSFGRVSRFGQILYSSSNETTGPLAHSVSDVHALFGKRKLLIPTLFSVQTLYRDRISMIPIVSTLPRSVRCATWTV